MRFLQTVLTAGVVLATTTGCQTTPVQAPSPATDRFFNTLTNLCGARYEGASVFPEDPGDSFRDKILVATISTCAANEVRVPFVVGEDHSRTWVIRRVDEGLELKHDHRHADGSPDEVTNYGGVTNNPGTPLEQSFPADTETAALLPEAATNEWWLQFSADLSVLTYYLERHGKPRFKAVLKRVRMTGD